MGDTVPAPVSPAPRHRWAPLADHRADQLLEGEEDEDGGGDDAAATLLNEANDLYMVELREAVQQGVDRQPNYTTGKTPELSRR